MLMMVDIKSSKKEFLTSLFIIVALQIILGLQGFDVCDDGFVLTFYQQFFNDPSSVEYNFIYWFVGLIGGIWYELFPQGGLIWFRLLTVLINTFSFVVAYNIFKPLIGSRLSILGVSIALFVNDFGFLTFYHNQLTILLLLIGVYYILKGLKTNHNFLIIWAGFFIGLCIFTRLTNATLLIFIFVFPISNYISGERLSLSIRKVFNFCLGLFISFGFIIILLFLLNQQGIMLNAISSLVDLGNTQGSSHGFSRLIRVYIHDYKFLMTSILKFIILILFFMVTTKLTKKNKIIRNAVFVINFILFFLWFNKGNVYAIYTVAYLGAFFILIDKEYEKELRSLSVMSLFILTFLTLGSAGAILSSGYMAVWFSTPLFFYYFYNLNATQIIIKKGQLNYEFLIEKEIFKNLTIVLFVSFFLAKTYNISKEAYFDSGSRFNKTYEINNKLAKGVYTKKRRAKIINELLEQISTLVKKDDYLLAYDDIPMIHFLTETKPYLYNPWVNIYDSNTFDKKLDKAQKEINKLPVIIEQKFSTIWDFSEPIDDYLTKDIKSTDDENRIDVIKKNRRLKTFINDNDYEIVWSNDYFNILKTKSYQTNKFFMK